MLNIVHYHNLDNSYATVWVLLQSHYDLLIIVKSVGPLKQLVHISLLHLFTALRVCHAHQVISSRDNGRRGSLTQVLPGLQGTLPVHLPQPLYLAVLPPTLYVFFSLELEV